MFVTSSSLAAVASCVTTAPIDCSASGNPYRPHPSPHTGIEIGLDEVKAILSPELWQKCSYSRQPICYFCKTPSPEFVPGLCPEHNWCRTCLVNIYSVAIRPPGCCSKMAGHWDHLPIPVVALYGSRIRPSCNAWKDSDEQRRLKSDLKDWQDKNRDIVFSAVAREALKDKDARIQDLKAELKDVEAQLKACNEKCSEYQKKRATESPASNLNDELVRQRMKIQELERSNKILRDANNREQAKFVEAGRARKIAVDNEAALRKQNEDLRARLAAATSNSGQNHHTPPVSRSGDNRTDSRGRDRSTILDDLAVAQAAERIASTNNAACQNRVKDLEAELLRVRQDAQKQQRSIVDSNKKIQIQLAAAKAAEKIANDNNDAAQQKIKDLQAKVADLQLELKDQAKIHKDRQTEMQQEVVAAQLAEKAAVTAEATARKQFEELKALLPTTDTKDACTQTPTGADDTLDTPVTLLKAKLHYARSLQTAAENNAMLALDETLELKAQLKKYHKFEGEAKKEFDKANRMYSSLQHKYERAMASLQRIQEQKNGAFKISASQFANDVNDNGQSAGSFRLLKLSEQLEPVKEQIRKAQAKKSKKAPEPPLKIAARRNRRLRDIIREREQEMANIRIYYGQKWTKVIAGMADRDSEIRQLKRRLMRMGG